MVLETDAHAVVTPGSCKDKETRVYYKDKDKYCFYDDNVTIYPTYTTETHCPEGWELVGKVKDPGTYGCAWLRSLPECRKKTFSQEKWYCCAHNDGTDIECPPGYCIGSGEKAEGNDTMTVCDKAMIDKCITGNKWANFATVKECRDWALSKNVQNRVGVLLGGVVNFCNFPAFAKLPFCSCVNSYKPELCTSDDCFAKRNPGKSEFAWCASKECKSAQKGDNVFLPNVDCASTVCAPILEIKQSDVALQDALTLKDVCNFNAQQQDLLAGRINALDVLQNPAGKTASELLKEGKSELGISTGSSSGTGDSSGGSGSGSTTESQGMPAWEIAVIAGGVFLGLLLIIVAIYFVTRRKSRPVAGGNVQMSPDQQFYQQYGPYGQF